MTLDGNEVLLLCSNNYLGLADDPRVREAAAAAAIEWGAGAGAVAPDLGQHGPASRTRVPAGRASRATSRRCSSAPATSPTPGRSPRSPGAGEVVFSDELNHASIIDGCRLSRAETFVYRHGDLEHLAWGLREAGERAALIVSDGIFSMDGDVAPLQGLFELSRRHGCRLMVDEAHATGAIGPGGRGSVAAAGLSGEVDVVVGTLGKALGSYGAYVCAGAEVADFLVNDSRPFIFSTAPPPPAVGAAAMALELLEAEPERVDRLQANAATLRSALRQEGLVAGASTTQIVPIEVGEAETDDGALRARPASAASSPRESARRPCRRAPRGCASR